MDGLIKFLKYIFTPPFPLLELPSTTNFACSLWTTCRWRGASDHLAPVNDQLCLVTNLSCLVTAHNLTTPLAWLFAGYLVYTWGGGGDVISHHPTITSCKVSIRRFTVTFFFVLLSNLWRVRYFHWLQLSKEFDKLVRNSVPQFEK